MIIQGISAFFATAAFSILFYIPKKYIIHAGFTGSIGWFIYLLFMRISDDKVIANFAATLLVTLTAHIMARKLKTPVTMFLIPGIIPLVPGAGMYQIVLNMINNTLDEASYYFFETIKMAGAIALGIFIIDTLFRSRQRLK
ncbi:MAG: hypothetical protein K0S76_1623 [Herbinix sp.]|jgi:uncharacterized membrane protein YjjB (DUF3815 family)|nr:hypothetical protein [Herbinix sp.]